MARRRERDDRKRSTKERKKRLLCAVVYGTSIRYLRDADGVFGRCFLFASSSFRSLSINIQQYPAISCFID